MKMKFIRYYLHAVSRIRNPAANAGITRVFTCDEVYLVIYIYIVTSFYKPTDKIKKMQKWHSCHAISRNKFGFVHYQLHDSAAVSSRHFLRSALRTQHYSSQGNILLLLLPAIRRLEFPHIQIEFHLKHKIRSPLSPP